jgi:macrolide transport system ATP-binding/permease protein
VIADEPTGELDSTTGVQIFRMLREIADGGVTIVTATHDPFVIEHVDRVEEMADGQLLPEEQHTLAVRRDVLPISPDGLAPGGSRSG